MKTLWLMLVSTLFLTGCVYTHPAPYGYSRYTVVTPAYPRYERHYYSPPPPPRFHYYEAPRHHPHPRSHRYW